jgi:hypothetical protein
VNSQKRQRVVCGMSEIGLPLAILPMAVKLLK